MWLYTLQRKVGADAGGAFVYVLVFLIFIGVGVNMSLAFQFSEGRVPPRETGRTLLLTFSFAYLTTTIGPLLANLDQLYLVSFISAMSLLGIVCNGFLPKERMYNHRDGAPAHRDEEKSPLLPAKPGGAEQPHRRD